MEVSASTIRVLFIGDIFGLIGKRVLAERLPSLLEAERIDICIANGENAAGGNGLTGNLVKKFRKFGINVLTGGNHSFSVPDKDIEFMEHPHVLRPLNFPEGNPGHGSTIFELSSGVKVGIVNLIGRTYLHEIPDCPFRIGKAAIEKLKTETPIIITDFHAEATSEKVSFAWYVDGLASAVLGTHTHVQTGDERILPGGTGYITDVGMTGPENSSIGMKPESVIKRFLLQTHSRFEPSESGPMLNAVILEIDSTTGKTITIKRVYERITFSYE
jgi:metallophosphoesterase (TIGR00282 family)